jgi:hypothetical protein
MGGGERPLIRQFGNSLVGRPVAVRSVGLDTDQHRTVFRRATLRPLQRRRELERVARYDTVVEVSHKAVMRSRK